jgi:hypothetical protein
VHSTSNCCCCCCCCSRISRRVIAEQHLHIANARPGYIGSIATALDVADAVDFAGQRAVQVRNLWWEVWSMLGGVEAHDASSPSHTHTHTHTHTDCCQHTTRSSIIHSCTRRRSSCSLVLCCTAYSTRT